MSWLDALFDPADLARFLDDDDDDDDDDDGDWPVPALAKAAGARGRKLWYEQPFGFVVGLADDRDGQPDLAQAQPATSVTGRTLAQAKRQAARWYNRQESRQRLPALRPPYHWQAWPHPTADIWVAHHRLTPAGDRLFLYPVADEELLDLDLVDVPARVGQCWQQPMAARQGIPEEDLEEAVRRWLYYQLQIRGGEVDDEFLRLADVLYEWSGTDYVISLMLRCTLRALAVRLGRPRQGHCPQGHSSAPVVDRRRPGGYILAPPPTCPACDRPMETTAGSPWPTHWIGHQPPHWHPVHSLTPRPLFPEVTPMPMTDDHIIQMLAAYYLGRAALDPLAPVIKVEQWQPALLPIVWDILGVPAHQREQATEMVDHELDAPAADLMVLLVKLRATYCVASPPLLAAPPVAARLLSILGRLRHQMTAYPAVRVEVLLPSLVMMTVTVMQLLDLDLQTARLMEMVDLLLAYRDRFAPDDTPAEWLAALPQIRTEWHARAQLLTQLEGPADGAPADGGPDLTLELDDLLELPSPALRYSIRVLLQGASGDQPWWRFDTGLEIRDALVEAWIGRRQHDGRARPFACLPISPGWLVALALDEVQAMNALWDVPGIASPDDVHAPLVGTTVEFYMRDGQQRNVETLTGLDVLALFRQLAAAADRSGVVRLTDGEGEEILIAISEIQMVMATMGWIVYGRVDLPEDQDEYYDMQP